MNETIAKRKSEIISGLAQSYVAKTRAEEEIKRFEAAYQELEYIENANKKPNDPPPPEGR